MIDLKLEELVPLSKAPSYYPGYRPHRASCFRHAFRGCGGVRLETVRVGGRRFTSVEAIRRFVRAASVQGDVEATAPHRGATDVEGELIREGF